MAAVNKDLTSLRHQLPSITQSWHVAAPLAFATGRAVALGALCPRFHEIQNSSWNRNWNFLVIFPTLATKFSFVFHRQFYAFIDVGLQFFIIIFFYYYDFMTNNRICYWSCWLSFYPPTLFYWRVFYIYLFYLSLFITSIFILLLLCYSFYTSLFIIFIFLL